MFQLDNGADVNCLRYEDCCCIMSSDKPVLKKSSKSGNCIENMGQNWSLPKRLRRLITHSTTMYLMSPWSKWKHISCVMKPCSRYWFWSWKVGLGTKHKFHLCAVNTGHIETRYRARMESSFEATELSFRPAYINDAWKSASRRRNLDS